MVKKSDRVKTGMYRVGVTADPQNQHQTKTVYVIRGETVNESEAWGLHRHTGVFESKWYVYTVGEYRHTQIDSAGVTPLIVGTIEDGPFNNKKSAVTAAEQLVDGSELSIETRKAIQQLFEDCNTTQECICDAETLSVIDRSTKVVDTDTQVVELKVRVDITGSFDVQEFTDGGSDFTVYEKNGTKIELCGFENGAVVLSVEQTTDIETEL